MITWLNCGNDSSNATEITYNKLFAYLYTKKFCISYICLYSYCDSEIDKSCKALLFNNSFYCIFIQGKIPIFYVTYIRYLIFSFDKGCFICS